MHSTKLQHYRERLLDERRQLVRETDRVLDAIPEEVHPPGEHEIAPSEGVDVEMSLEQSDRSRLRDIDAALQRIKEGTFGACCACGAEISVDRLEAVPFAMFCVSCEKTRERA